MNAIINFFKSWFSKPATPPPVIVVADPPTEAQLLALANKLAASNAKLQASINS